APIETGEGTYKRQPGDPAAAAAMLADLEMHSMIGRLGLPEPGAAAPAAAAEVPAACLSPLPESLTGPVYLARGEQGWYAVADGAPYSVEEDRLPALLDGEAELRVFDA